MISRLSHAFPVCYLALVPKSYGLVVRRRLQIASTTFTGKGMDLDFSKPQKANLTVVILFTLVIFEFSPYQSF